MPSYTGGSHPYWTFAGGGAETDGAATADATFEANQAYTIAILLRPLTTGATSEAAYSTGAAAGDGTDQGYAVRFANGGSFFQIEHTGTAPKRPGAIVNHADPLNTDMVCVSRYDGAGNLHYWCKLTGGSVLSNTTTIATDGDMSAANEAEIGRLHANATGTNSLNFRLYRMAVMRSLLNDDQTTQLLLSWLAELA